MLDVERRSLRVLLEQALPGDPKGPQQRGNPGRTLVRIVEVSSVVVSMVQRPWELLPVFSTSRHI